MVDENVILVTGASGNIGQAIAKMFLEDEANFIFLGVHRNAESIQSLVDENSGRCEIVTFDVTSSEAWKKTVEAIIEKRERIDVLVNNAGGHEDGLLAQMTEGSWSKVIDLNLNSVFHGSQSVLPQMIYQRQGRIINMASLSALLAPAGQTNYASAKAGVVAMTQSLAKEVARIGITVNAVCPGYIDSQAVDDFPPDIRKAALQKIPMRRFGKPEEVAALVKFLASLESSYVTGAAIKVDGGLL